VFADAVIGPGESGGSSASLTYDFERLCARCVRGFRPLVGSDAEPATVTLPYSCSEEKQDISGQRTLCGSISNR
jgi:hypothetical protein